MKRLQTQRGRVRLRDKDIFVPGNDVPHEEVDRDFGEEVPEREVYCYTIAGDHDYLDGQGNPALMDTEDEEAEDRAETFAMKVLTSSGTTRYFIKQGPDGRLFNPLGIDEWTHNKTRKGGDKVWHYHQVGSEAFDLYIKFLRTKNTAYHKNAEREAF